MSRLSIEIPDHQHQQIKAMAAMRGLSIKDYIIEKTLPKEDDNYTEEELAALEKLKEYLLPSIEAAKRGEFATATSIEEIIAEAKAERGL